MEIELIVFSNNPSCSRLTYGKSFYSEGDFSAPRSSVIRCFSQKNEMVVIDEKKEDQLSFTQRYEVKESVRKLLKIAGEENWDREDALPILPENVEIAQSVVDLFPSSDFLPEVSATPHGEIDFDWIISKNIMLTLSVCPTGRIAYSGIFTIEGSEKWNGQLPSDVVCWLAGLQKMPAETNE